MEESNGRHIGAALLSRIRENRQCSRQCHQAPTRPIVIIGGACNGSNR